MSSSDNVTQQAPHDHQAPEVVEIGLATVKKIVIEFIDPKDHRYDTVGDWQQLGSGTLLIKSSHMSDPRYSIAVAFHELIEALACIQNGVTSEMVDNFDMGEGAGLDEPGRSPSAPYHKEHALATAMERRLITHLGVDWDTYDKAVSDKGEE